MSTIPFATASDVELRWRPLSSGESAIAEVLADDASDMVRSRWSDVDQRIENGSLTSNSVTRVVANMVKRAMISLGAEGVESRTQAAGPFSYSDKYANPNGNLYFTADDIRVFEGEPGIARVGWLA